MIKVKVIVIIVLVFSFFSNNLFSKPLSVVVDLKKESRVTLNGKKIAIGQTLLEGDIILIKKKAYVKIMNRFGQMFILRYRGIYKITMNGSVSSIGKSKKRKIKSKSYYASLRSAAGYGYSRSVDNKNSLPSEVRKLIDQTKTIDDAYLRHLARYYIFKKYGFISHAAKEAAHCINK